jgi:hypothetical protein
MVPMIIITFHKSPSPLNCSITSNIRTLGKNFQYMKFWPTHSLRLISVWSFSFLWELSSPNWDLSLIGIYVKGSDW